MTRSDKCPECGQHIGFQWNFCIACGHHLHQPKARKVTQALTATLRCPDCGEGRTWVRGEHWTDKVVPVYCYRCGALLVRVGGPVSRVRFSFNFNLPLDLGNLTSNLVRGLLEGRLALAPGILLPHGDEPPRLEEIAIVPTGKGGGQPRPPFWPLVKTWDSK